MHVDATAALPPVNALLPPHNDAGRAGLALRHGVLGRSHHPLVSVDGYGLNVTDASVSLAADASMVKRLPLALADAIFAKRLDGTVARYDHRATPSASNK